MADQLTPEISDRICKHMNDDHAAAVLVYAQVHGAVVAGSTQQVRVVFDRELTDSEDAHQVLIQMARSGRSKS
jgi:putative heme iron utilization protein